MNNRILIGLALLAATGALLVAGCGGDDDESTTALSEDEFVTQANEICAEGEKALDQATEDAFADGGQPSPEELEEYVSNTLVPNIQDQIDGIRALGTPEEIADDVDTFITDAEAALGEIEDDPALVVAGDEGPFADVNQQADALGLTECAG